MRKHSKSGRRDIILAILMGVSGSLGIRINAPFLCQPAPIEEIAGTQCYDSD